MIYYLLMLEVMQPKEFGEGGDRWMIYFD